MALPNGMDTAAPRVVGPGDGKAGFLGSIGVRFMIDAADSGGGFALVEHAMSARALGAPLHRHTREDEYTYVLERFQLRIANLFDHGESTVACVGVRQVTPSNHRLPDETPARRRRRSRVTAPDFAVSVVAF